MNDKKLIKTVNTLLYIASSLIVISSVFYVAEDHKRDKADPMPEVEVIIEEDAEPVKEQKREANPVFQQVAELKNIWQEITIEYTTLEFEYIGQHFITAYCPEECGYRTYSDGSDNFPTGWITSTGTVCHREEEWYIPSTCGIDTRYHRYGELFLIDGKIFVAEDTGPGAVGAWIDTFMPNYEMMSSFGSHWTDVYSVEYVDNSISSEERKVQHERLNAYLHGSCIGCRIPCRNYDGSLH